MPHGVCFGDAIHHGSALEPYHTVCAGGYNQRSRSIRDERDFEDRKPEYASARQARVFFSGLIACGIAGTQWSAKSRKTATSAITAPDKGRCDEPYVREARVPARKTILLDV